MKILEWYVRDCNTCAGKDANPCAGIYGACWEAREVTKPDPDFMTLAKEQKVRDEERKDFENLQHQQPYGWWRNR
jgi:hypothetical protein